jgi:Uma2 family endonuclease
MALVERLTIEDFEQLPDALALNHELVDGKLVDVSGNKPYHNSLRDLLVILLGPHVMDRKLGKIISEQEFDFDGNAHGPDVSFIEAPKLHLIDPERRVQLFVPDLAIEIVSKRDTFDQLIQKAKRYRRCGTREVWVLDVKNRLAFVLAEDRQTILDDKGLFETKLIPGFSTRLGDLFDRI